MTKLLDGRVAVVTGGGRGIGRDHALSLARHGAKVVVNDLGGELDGTGSDPAPAQAVVDEIVGAGGEAVANGDDVADWEGAKGLVDAAIETFGDLHVVVNNAGILRDRVLANMTEEEWDAVIRVHLKGTFAPPAGPSPTGASRPRRARRSPAGSSTPRRCPASTATPARPTTARPRPASPPSPTSPPSRSPATA